MTDLKRRVESFVGQVTGIWPEPTMAHDALPAGFYWYLVADEPPTLVEVTIEPHAAAPHRYVSWLGADEPDPIRWCPGLFVGPLAPPVVEVPLPTRGTEGYGRQ